MSETTTQFLRELVKKILNDGLGSSSGVFYAFKLVTLSSSSTSSSSQQEKEEDVLLLAKSLRNDGQSRRAHWILQSSPYNLLTNPRFLLVSTQCLCDAGEWDEARQQLERFHSPSSSSSSPPFSLGSTLNDNYNTTVDAQLWTLRGRANNAVEKHSEAKRCFLKALEIDPLCYDSLSCLVDGHFFETKTEEDEVLRSLEKKLPGGTNGIFANLFRSRTASSGMILSSATLQSLPTTCETSINFLGESQLANDIDVLTSKAEMLFSRQFFRESYQITTQMLKKDPNCIDRALIIHLSCLVELKMEEELSECAHRLSEDFPEKSITWYAIGCFSLCKNDFESARTHFAKATTIDRTFAAAWLAFGHTFSRRNEHDQAIAAYRTVMRLFPGCHIAPLCLGMEMALSNNLKGALKFFEIALSSSPDDPLVHNELGSCFYHLHKYEVAVVHFERAIALAQSLGEHGLPLETIETFYNNHAQALRKLGRLKEAEIEFTKAVGLAPTNSSVYASLAFTLQLEGRFDEASKFYHASLSISDDSLITDLFNCNLKALFINRYKQK